MTLYCKNTLQQAPSNALSDGYQSLIPKRFRELLKKINDICSIVDKDFYYEK